MKDLFWTFKNVHDSPKGLLQSWQIGAMFPIDKEALENRIDFASTMTHMWLVNMDIKETDDI